MEHSKLSLMLERTIAVSAKMPQEFAEHVLVWTPHPETPFGYARNDDTLLRLTSSVFTDEMLFVAFGERSWTLSMLNTPEPEKTRMLATHRVVNATPLQGNAMQYVTQLGFRYHPLM